MVSVPGPAGIPVLAGKVIHCELPQALPHVALPFQMLEGVGTISHEAGPSSPSSSPSPLSRHPGESTFLALKTEAPAGALGDLELLQAKAMSKNDDRRKHSENIFFTGHRRAIGLRVLKRIR